MRLPILTSEQITFYQEKGLVPYDLNPFIPSFGEIMGRATVPYCIQAEGRWPDVRADQIAIHHAHLVHYFDPSTDDDSKLDLSNQETIPKKVIYKTYKERTGITLWSDNRIMIVTPPILGVNENNEPIMTSWPRDASVSEINQRCLQIREILHGCLFALTVRVLNCR